MPVKTVCGLLLVRFADVASIPCQDARKLTLETCGVHVRVQGVGQIFHLASSPVESARKRERERKSE